MDIRTLLDFMNIAEKLKCNTRHSWTSSGRRESVAEHTCRLCMFAWLVKDEFPDVDMDKVIKMCLFHDLGEAVTGDVPCFDKTEAHREVEEDSVKKLAELLPEEYEEELIQIFEELEENVSKEAKLTHALDKMEALIQHNEAPIDSWLPLEYELQMTYGQEQAKAFPYLQKLRKTIEQDSVDKIEREGKAEKKEAGFYVSKEKNRLRIERITELMRQSYWAKDRPKEMIRKAVENSVNYGVYNDEDYMVGYARIITDYTRVFYLMDVIIDEAYRHQGLGTLLMDEVMADVGHLYGVLHTSDAHEFYAKYGFEQDEKRMKSVMEKTGD